MLVAADAGVLQASVVGCCSPLTPNRSLPRGARGGIAVSGLFSVFGLASRGRESAGVSPGRPGAGLAHCSITWTA